MPTDVIMPQMGESIFEGTLTKWLKKPGDKVQRDEPLFEISTDKVDAEIPAPASGVLKEIKVAEGATVQVNTVVGLIDAEGSASAASAPAPQPTQAPAKTTDSAPSDRSAQADGASTPKQPPATEKTPVLQPSAAATKGSNGTPSTDVVMPQMGESIFEGTITKWLKKVGDKVQRDEPLFEISTDKVDAEIPAPTSGVLREIKVSEGNTVQVNTVVAVIGGAGAPAQAAAPAEVVPAAKPVERPEAQPQREQVIDFPAADHAQHGERLRSSPLVRRIARESNVNLEAVPGTGLGGRITKHDIQDFIQQHGAGSGRPAASAPAHQPAASQPQPVLDQPQPRPATTAAASAPMLPELQGELVPMTPMRKKIAAHGGVAPHQCPCPHRLQGGYDPHRE